MLSLRNALALVSLLAASTSLAQDVPDSPYLAVSGHAEQQVVPDIFPIVIELSMSSMDAAAAQKEIEGLAQRVLDAAQVLHVADKDITVGNLRIAPAMKWDSYGKKNEFTGNDYQRRIELRLRKLDDLRELVAKLPASENMKLQTQAFQFSGARELRRKLRTQAVQDARAAAVELAAAVGRPLGEVYNVSDQPLAGGRYTASFGYGAINAIDVARVESSNILTSEMIVKEGVTTISADAYLVYRLGK